MSYQDEEGPEDYLPREPDERFKPHVGSGGAKRWDEDLLAEAEHERMVEEADPPAHRLRRLWRRMRHH